MSDAERQQQRIREFLQLLPLTAELAGLPRSDHGRYYTPEQIEARAITLRHAYKMARKSLSRWPPRMPDEACYPACPRVSWRSLASMAATPSTSPSLRRT